MKLTIFNYYLAFEKNIKTPNIFDIAGVYISKGFRIVKKMLFKRSKK